MKKIIKIFFAGITIIAIIVYNVPIFLDFTRDSYEYQMNNLEYKESCELIIRGYYSLNLFTPDKFVGKIIVSNHPAKEVMDNNLLELVFENNNCSEIYYDQTGEYGYPLGQIYQRKLMRDLCLLVNVDNNGRKIHVPIDAAIWSSENGYFICNDKTDYNSAVKVLVDYNVIQ